MYFTVREGETETRANDVRPLDRGIRAYCLAMTVTFASLGLGAWLPVIVPFLFTAGERVPTSGEYVVRAAAPVIGGFYLRRLSVRLCVAMRPGRYDAASTSQAAGGGRKICPLCGVAPAFACCQVCGSNVRRVGRYRLRHVGGAVGERGSVVHGVARPERKRWAWTVHPPRPSLRSGRATQE